MWDVGQLWWARAVWCLTACIPRPHRAPQLYKEYVDPEFTWSNFTVEEQAKVCMRVCCGS